MVATLVRWEITTDPDGAIRISRFEVVEPEASPSMQELEQEAGEFIARQVLEKDTVFFEG